MEYQKKSNKLEINNYSWRTYNTNSQIKFKTMMLKSNLCSYSDVYTLVKETITIPDMASTGAAANNDAINKQ